MASPNHDSAWWPKGVGASHDQPRRRPLVTHADLGAVSKPRSHPYPRPNAPPISPGSALVYVDLSRPSLRPAVSPPRPQRACLFPSVRSNDHKTARAPPSSPPPPACPHFRAETKHACIHSSVSCCPLAPANRSASGLAINICDVLVEEGGASPGRSEAERWHELEGTSVRSSGDSALAINQEPEGGPYEHRIRRP